MAGGTGPFRPDDAGFDRRAGALVVEEGERVAGERPVEVRGDVERGALAPCYAEMIISPRSAEVREVDPLEGQARGDIGAIGQRLAPSDHLAGRIGQLPIERCAVRLYDRGLGVARLEAELIEADRDVLIGSFLLRRSSGEEEGGKEEGQPAPLPFGEGKAVKIPHSPRPANTPKTEPTKPPATLVVRLSVSTVPSCFQTGFAPGAA